MDETNKVCWSIEEEIRSFSLLLRIGFNRWSNDRKSVVLCPRSSSRERLCLYLSWWNHASMAVPWISLDQRYCRIDLTCQPPVGSWRVFRVNDWVTPWAVPFKSVWRESRNVIENVVWQWNILRTAHHSLDLVHFEPHRSLNVLSILRVLSLLVSVCCLRRRLI